MPAITISGEPSEIMALLDLFTNRPWLQRQFDGVSVKLDSIKKELQKMVTVEEFGKFATDLNREVGQIKDFIAGLEGQISANASDAEFRAFVEAALPGLKGNVDTLDTFTPEAPAPAPEG